MSNLYKLMFVFVVMTMVGCGANHHGIDPMPMEDAAIPTGDTGPVTEEDAGLTPEVDAGTDSGPIVMVDAGLPEADAGIEIPAMIVEAYNMRNSTILVAGGDVWQQVAQYSFHTVTATSAITAVDVTLDGDAADLTEVAIAYDGLLYGADVFPSGFGSTRHIILDAPIVADFSSSVGTFQVWVKTLNVQAFASVSGADIGVCNSGDRFRVGVYGVDYQISTATGHANFGAIYGNEFQIRKSKPTITRQALATTNLSNGGSQDMYKLQASADLAGSIAMHQIPFDVVGGYSEFTLQNFGLRKGPLPMSPSDYSIVDETGADLTIGTLIVSPTTSHLVIIRFLHEQTITGSGNVYTLYATPGGVVFGDSVSFSFHRTETGATGYLTNDPLASSLDTSAYGSPESGLVVPAGFIWSDNSEIPHSDSRGTLGGSRDWTDGRYVDDLTQTQTLTR